MNKSELIRTIPALKKALGILIKNENFGFLLKSQILVVMTYFVVLFPIVVVSLLVLMPLYSNDPGTSILQLNQQQGSLVTQQLLNKGETPIMNLNQSEVLSSTMFGDDSIPMPPPPHTEYEAGPMIIICIVTLALFGVLLTFQINMNIFAVLMVTQNQIVLIRELVKKSFVALPKMLILNLILFFVLLIGFIFFIIPGIILWYKYFLSIYIILNEECGPIEAMKRSSKLIAGYKVAFFWKITGLTLIMFLLILPIALVMTFAYYAGMSYIFTSILGLVFMIFYTILYLDLKRIKENEELGSFSSEAQTATTLG